MRRATSIRRIHDWIRTTTSERQKAARVTYYGLLEGVVPTPALPTPLLTLVDALRVGRARERQRAKVLLRERLATAAEQRG